MFYTAYFKKGAPAADRPITFIYNGGPGSSTMWLHLGAFGPKRIVTSDDGNHTPAAPYSLVNNSSSLMDVSDMVFIDAPGAGFSRIAGPSGTRLAPSTSKNSRTPFTSTCISGPVAVTLLDALIRIPDAGWHQSHFWRTRCLNVVCFDVTPISFVRPKCLPDF